MPRPRGQGTVVTIKGRFYARWTVNGKRVYGSPHDTFAAADRECIEGGPDQPERTSRREIPTLAQWTAAQQAGDYGKRIANTTHSLNETIRLRYVEITPLGAKRLHRISRADCQAWADQVPGSASYRRRCSAFVSKMFSLGVAAGHIRANPMKGVWLPEVEERENRTLSPTEAMKLLNPATRTDCIMLVAMHIGMRRSELVRLEWWHVGEDVVKVPGTKTTRSKGAVPLTPEARDAINSQPRRSEFVFSTEDGKPLSAHNVTRDVRRRKVQVGLPPETRLQDLRGSYVSLLIEQGTDPRTVMELARHSDLRTTMKAYARSREVVKQEAVERLRNAITSGSK
ncbi:MAG: tyrosine-type recombinase/integrase [Fimbriimonadaceae bacterium]